MKKWTDRDQDSIARQLKEGASTADLAAKYKTTPGAIRGITRRLGVRIPWKYPAKRKSGELEKSDFASTSVHEDRAEMRARLRDEEHKAAKRKYLESLREQELDDVVTDIFRESIAKAYGDTFKIELKPFRKQLRTDSVAEEAVLVISDTHVGKLVEPGETNGFGLYNPLRFLAKLEHLEKTVSHIIQERNNCKIGNPISRLHVMLLGDLVDGMLNHAEEIPGHTYVSQQVHLASLALFQTIARLALVVDGVSVYGVGGNHARWPNQRKVPTVGRFSNLDTIVMEWIQSLLNISGAKNITTRFERSPHQIIDILGTRICVSHGCELTGGDKAMGVPIHAIARQINSMTQRLAARNEPVPRLYIVGDKHKRIELPTARGSYIVNGAFPGTDGYSLGAGFSETLPEQVFFGLHPKYAKTWSYNLNISDEMVPLANLADLNFDLPLSIQEDLLRFES